MLKIVHRVAALLGLACISTFFLSTVVTELFGTHQAIAHLKSLIVMPGIWILIPSLALAGITGGKLGHSRRGALVDGKRFRTRILATNGLLILTPCALVLDHWASSGKSVRFSAVAMA